MLRSLLVGVNGSRWSEAACDIGLSWAARSHIPLTCLGVVDLAALIQLQARPLGGIESACPPMVIEAEQEKVATALADAGRKADRAGVACRLLNREGSPAVLLGEEAQRHDLLILGRRSDPKTGTGCKPSDTLVEILKHAPRPIILAAQEIPQSSDVVIAYDGSVQSARTLQSFVSSGIYHGHPLHVVGISNEPEQMSHVLSRATDFLAAHGLRAEADVLPTGDNIAQTLIKYAKRIPAGLLVIGAYGQPWYKELLFGSVTISVLADCPIPLFLNH